MTFVILIAIGTFQKNQFFRNQLETLYRESDTNNSPPVPLETDVEKLKKTFRKVKFARCFLLKILGGIACCCFLTREDRNRKKFL